MSAIVRTTHYNRLSSSVNKPASVELLEHITVAAEDTVAPYEPERRLLARRLSQELKQALDRLPEDHRVAILLIDVQGFRYADAALALDVAPGTVASRVARARAALRGCLGHMARERGWEAKS